MASDKNEERLPPRRPFTYEIKDSKLLDLYHAYEELDEVLFNKKPKEKKKKYLR